MVLLPFFRCPRWHHIAAILENRSMPKAINIRFQRKEKSPGPPDLIFVEVEDDEGKSMSVGEWIPGEYDCCILRITELPKD